MILREIKNMYIKNRLTEGVDFKRYEWLKADIPIGTTMMSLPINSRNFEFKRNWIQIMNSGYFVTLSSNTYYSYFIIDNIDGNDRYPQIWDNTNRIVIFNSSINVGLGIHTIIANDNGVTISSTTNTATLPLYGEPNYISFNNASNFNRNTIHLTSSIKVDGVTRYVPCQLLHAIPASLDANNIARNAGECGMYDSISGKFYGNVASTGTFTVEGDIEPETHTGLQQIYQNKLIEGVDYETYDWLKGDGTAYIDTKVTDLSISDYIKTIFDDSGNIGIKIRTWGREKNRVVVGNNKSTTSITVWGSSTSFVYNNDGVYLYDMYFDLLNNKVTINNTIFNLSLPHDNGASFLLFAIRNSSNAVDYKNLAKYKSFEIHNQINLVPCTLLRSIPRNLDAQCITRQAGECGMIDLISGKFYGNVASNGTFTVENDNNE